MSWWSANSSWTGFLSPSRASEQADSGTLRHFPQMSRDEAPAPKVEPQQDVPGVVSTYTRGSITPSDSPERSLPEFHGQNANVQYGSWSGQANSTIASSWLTSSSNTTAMPDNSITLDVPMVVWNWAALQTTPPSGVWTYGNWAGPGGAGAPIDNLDAGAMMHDYCYHQGGFSAMSNYGGHSDALQACNQALCDTAAKAESAALAPIESAAAKNQGPNDPGGHLMNAANAAADVVSYFSKVPFGNSCKVHP